MGTLSPTDIMGLYVAFGISFLPIAVVVLMAVLRFVHYRDVHRAATRIRNVPTEARDRSIIDFISTDRSEYEAHRRVVNVVLPFHLYLFWMFCNAGIEAASFFLVWYDPGRYHNWVYQTSMGLQFAIALGKVFWLLAFFAVTHYKSTAVAAGILLALTMTNAIILAINDPHIVYNWVLDWLAVIFYLYTAVIMVHFYHMSERNEYYRGSVPAFAESIDIIGWFYREELGGYHTPRATGVRVDPANRFPKRPRGDPG
jgi:hypothetical protein